LTLDEAGDEAGAERTRRKEDASLSLSLSLSLSEASRQCPSITPIRPDHRCNVESSTLRPSGLSWPGTPTEFNELVQSGVDAARAASSYKNKPLSLEAVRSRAKDFERRRIALVTRRRGKVPERGVTFHVTSRA